MKSLVRWLASAAAAALVVGGLSTSVPASARGGDTSTVTMTFKQSRNLPTVQYAYLCDEPCFKKLKHGHYQQPATD